MLLNLIRNGFERDMLIMTLLSIPVIVFSLSFHECSHAFTANLLGDKTARYMGRLTLNPIKHLDPIGALAMLLCGVGWAKPVPINPRNFDSPKWGMAISSAAGPISNMLLGIVSAFFYRLFLVLDYKISGAPVHIFEILAYLFLVSMIMNVTLALFNLIPIPPFDGSRILFVFLPEKAYFSVMRYEEALKMIVLLLVVGGTFSGILSSVVDKICGGMYNLMSMIIPV